MATMGSRPLRASGGPATSQTIEIRRPGFRLILLLLAVLDLASVGVGVSLNHEMMAAFREAIVVNDTWANRLHAYSQLGELAGNVNAPTNEVFVTQDIASEKSRMRAAQRVFTDYLGSLRTEITRDMTPTQGAIIRNRLDQIQSAMSEMNSEQEKLFEILGKNDTPGANERLAVVNRKFSVVASALADLRETVGEVQRESLRAQESGAGLLAQFAVLSGALMLALVVGITFYAYRHAPQLPRGQSKKDATPAEPYGLSSARRPALAADEPAAPAAASPSTASIPSLGPTSGQVAVQPLGNGIEPPSRSLLLSRLAQALSNGAGSAGRLALMLVDLDHFRDVVESHGALLADRLLVAVAVRLSSCVRSQDSVLRLGGDKFTILIEGVRDTDETMIVAKRIAQSFAKPFKVEGQEFIITASIGVAMGSDGLERPEDLMQKADFAIAQAKAAGGGKAVLYQPSGISAEITDPVALTLARAIQREEFTLRYEPVVDLSTMQVIGVESVPYWRHPKDGFLPVSDYAGVIEAEGLTPYVSRIVLRKACGQASFWRKQLAGSAVSWLSVSLSKAQLLDHALFEMVAATLKESGLPPSFLALDFPIKLLPNIGALELEQLERIERIGVRLTADGAGPLTVEGAMLQKVPLDFVKVTAEGMKPDAKLSVRASVPLLTTMTSQLGITIIAKTVKDFDEASELWSLGCTLAQGRFFSELLTADAMEALIVSSAAGQLEALTA